jgi:hypothetical protein
MSKDEFPKEVKDVLEKYGLHEERDRLEIERRNAKEPKAVLKCNDKNCTRPHYHLDSQIEKIVSVEQETKWDGRPVVEIGKDKKNDQ